MASALISIPNRCNGIIRVDIEFHVENQTHRETWKTLIYVRHTGIWKYYKSITKSIVLIYDEINLEDTRLIQNGKLGYKNMASLVIDSMINSALITCSNFGEIIFEIHAISYIKMAQNTLMAHH